MIGLSFKVSVTVEHESAQLRLDITKTATSAATKVSACRNAGTFPGTIESGVIRT